MELQAIKNKIITIQGQQVILDSDVAELYGVETKRINEAVKITLINSPKGTFCICLWMKLFLQGRKFRP